MMMHKRNFTGDQIPRKTSVRTPSSDSETRNEKKAKIAVKSLQSRVEGISESIEVISLKQVEESKRKILIHEEKKEESLRVDNSDGDQTDVDVDMVNISEL